LALDSGHLRWSPVAHTLNAEARENVAAARCALCCAQRPQTVYDIFLHRQVREESQILMHVTNAALPGGDVAFLF